jgi:hypothetical protein
MRSFSIRELRERSGDLSREAEQGKLSLVTRHGQPLFVSVPFTEELLQAGVHTSLALSLFRQGDISSGRAARLAGMTRPEFLEYASNMGVPVVDYDPAELDEELSAFDAMMTGEAP